MAAEDALIPLVPWRNDHHTTRYGGYNGVPVDGLPVVGCTSSTVNWHDIYGTLLGHRPPKRELGRNKNTGVMEGSRVKAKWLEDRFSNPLPVNALEEFV